MSVLESIDYHKIFTFFEEVSAVPRGSRYNDRISDYLVEFAKQRGLYVRQDEMKNVVIIKEASSGLEDCPAVILQGHMDMVCLSESGCDHNFFEDGLKLFIEGDLIHATGTTLGGDNGIAIAYALALLDSNEFRLPRLEVVITTDEEIGLLGATVLDTSELQAKYMLNLDSEEESSILVGCAGGLTAISKLPLEYEDKSGVELTIKVTGLLGGHSGIDIINHRANATHLLARTLMELKKEYSFAVANMSGGTKDNAIPNESIAKLIVSNEEVGLIKDVLVKLEEKYKQELLASEPGFHLQVVEGTTCEKKCLTSATFQKVILYILYQPNGIQAMSANIKGLVESSLNLGIFHMDEEIVTFSYSVRSSFASYKKFMSDKLKEFTEFLGGTYQTMGEYPAWEYKPDSKLRDLMITLYRDHFDREPIIEAIHAGLECGILADKMPGLDIVSIGPDMYDVHTPKERLSISSTKRVFDYLVKILEGITTL